MKSGSGETSVSLCLAPTKISRVDCRHWSDQWDNFTMGRHPLLGSLNHSWDFYRQFNDWVASFLRPNEKFSSYFTKNFHWMCNSIERILKHPILAKDIDPITHFNYTCCRTASLFVAIELNTMKPLSPASLLI